MSSRKEDVRAFVRNVFTGGMYDRYDIETSRRIIMVNVLIVVGTMFLVGYVIEYVYIGAYRMAIIDLTAALVLVLTGVHVRRTQTYHFASDVAVSMLGILFLYLAIAGGINNTGHLWAFTFPLLAVIHFGLRKGAIAISLFLGCLIFFFASDYPLAASSYSLDFKFRFISSLLAISIFGYVHEYIRIAFLNEIVRQNDELSRTQRLESLGFLAGGIAHDFSNILTGVIGNLGLLEMSVEKHNPDFKLVTAAKKAAERSLDLTQQLMTFARGGAPVKEPTSIEALLRETTQLSLRGSKIRPRYDFGKEALSPVDVDKGQIAQVVQNLVINADHAMPKGGALRVSAANVDIRNNDGAMNPGAYVKVSIEDEGVGIPEDAVQNVFEVYFTTKEAGQGLGLAISHSIVSKHDGYITVTSKVGVGTRFDIYLPASTEQPVPAAEREKVVARGTGRVLLMDDDETIQSTVGRMLEVLGYEVVGVFDGVEAITAYDVSLEAGRPYDVVIMDLTIPGSMGGKEAVSRLRRLHPAARVIVSSGYSNDPIMANYKDYGFDGKVKKPVDVVALAETLRAVIGA